MKRILILATTLAACVCTALQARAQLPVPPPAPQVQLRSGAELDQLLGPIALYPDPLIAEILPAATLPSDIVLADRYLNSGGDPNLIDLQLWSASVKALARYPAVLKWMDENLAWTTALGQAFLYQQPDVMNSIQRLRAQAQALGNLQSTPQETVMIDNGAIEILPANPQIIYVPVYRPEVVYYQRSFGTPFITFGFGFAVGAWLHHDFDWRERHLIVWRHDQPRPSDWWFRRPSERPRMDHVTVWHPHDHRGAFGRNLDRGWDAREVHHSVTIIGSQPRPVERREILAPPPRRSEPVIIRHPPAAPFSRPASGALIGIRSSHDAREFSTRGQESRQVISRPAAPAARPAAPARSQAPSRPGGPAKR